jgi:hypothetical protein
LDVKPQFSIKSVIRVQLDHDEDFGRTLVIDFLRWCEQNEIYGFRGASTGPEGLVKYFEVEDTDGIRAWFKEKDVKEVK